MSIVSRLLTRADTSARQPSPRTTTGIEIMVMQRRHLRAMMPIEQLAYPTPWSRSVFESELQQVANGSRHYVVAGRDRELIGYAGLWFVPDPDGDQAHVTNIVVAPSARRGRVGTRLMLHLASRAIDRGCVSWTLEVRASNHAAHELYRAFGFAPAGVRKRYYDNTEDAIVMWCHDLQSDDYRERLQRLADATDQTEQRT
jgi:[ribosomal protein S18]-alanine N-acetyltransferase